MLVEARYANKQKIRDGTENNKSVLHDKYTLQFATHHELIVVDLNIRLLSLSHLQWFWMTHLAEIFGNKNLNCSVKQQMQMSWELHEQNKQNVGFE